MGLQFEDNNREPENFSFGMEDVVAWKNGILIFDENNFDEVKSRLEKWYGVNLLITGNPPKDFVISGRYHKENLVNVLSSLQFARSFNFEIEDKNVKINFN